MAITDTNPRRRWYQFSLRTLLIAVTLLAPVFGWVGHSLSWIRQRHEWFRRSIPWGYMEGFTDEQPRAPGGLWLFGAGGFKKIPWVRGETPETQDELQKLFPEAEIDILDPW